ncbi:Uncharacterised protein [Mycobacterium tuberculosis]|nr:Uncharacterised protein [Mycobacterium tuberculosis]
MPLGGKLNTALCPPAALYASWNFRLLLRTKFSKNSAGMLAPPNSFGVPFPQ